MKALRFASTGSLDALEVAEVPLLERNEGEILVRVKGAGLNPSDVKNVLGKFPYTTLPRTPGRDFAGVVADGPEEMIGLEVWGTGNELGFTRDGSHAEYLTLPIEGSSPKPKSISFTVPVFETITFDGETRPFRARTASPSEKAELWPRVTAAYPGYAHYQERTRRDIPVVIREPRDPGPGGLLGGQRAHEHGRGHGHVRKGIRRAWLDENSKIPVQVRAAVGACLQTEAVAQRAEYGDDGDRDQGRDQAVLDRGRPALVLQKLANGAHGTFPHADCGYTSHCCSNRLMSGVARISGFIVMTGRAAGCIQVYL